MNPTFWTSNQRAEPHPYGDSAPHANPMHATRMAGNNKNFGMQSSRTVLGLWSNPVQNTA